MSYCPQCGCELEESHKFCPNCGAAVNPERQVPLGKIVFKRQPCAVAKLVKTKITVDGQVVVELREKEEFEYSLPVGQHNVEVQMKTSNQVLCMQINIEPAPSIWEFTFKIGASGKAVYCGKKNSSRGGEKRPKQTKSSTALMWLGLVSMILIMGLIAVMTNDSVDHVNPTHPIEVQEPTETMGFAAIVGTVGDWEITVNDFYYCDAIDAGLLHEYRAEEGSKYCVVNVTIKNIGTEASTFLPYLSFDSDSRTHLHWNGYEYKRSEQLSAEDNLSNENLNPLVFKTGNIVFEVPGEMETAAEAPVFSVTMGESEFVCELIKK